MILVTGAAGFIGSCLVGKLNNKGYKDILISDDFGKPEKEKNTSRKVFTRKIDRRELLSWLKANPGSVELVLHIGARTDTTETDMRIFDELNLGYTQSLWRFCAENNIPLIYASSAATYGDGSLGYDDDPSVIPMLKPLNAYGISKNELDKWAILQSSAPPFWYGLKFFNVYGPNEYHKGRMASVIFHAHRQILETGKVRLFRSHRPDFEDGKQLRDFIYVKDVTDVIFHLMGNPGRSGIYNLGTGHSRTFLDLARAVFAAMGREPDIEFIDTPADIRDKYQYFTEAKMEKLAGTGYHGNFHSLEEGVQEYVREYLSQHLYF
jgi:ADP-L-glycero-D-manno-heptose 6-epimerase